ncbi:RrF2 family transcriptional regulator [Micromonospora vinacea]|uniref:Rrf2 family protein n=1 Tax=Micromonospora vinacea TaxID=709878 RepID=A0ABS0KAM5_9ACTN|nr:Rrf2 family transcriptional regulator [Micromonospora vinacea]MBG6105556.1 Rrf2 family protein [Micromonospora vinacea]WSZ78278.1 Rrf2 family transcriptional regulator [Micromonospora sp. NBC_00860]WTA65295.1 Rrf2 family transcriptional regulator [Micromonospora sp. NBC_00855]
MRMSQGVEWALHTCLNLSWLDAPVPTSTLAAFYELPPAYLNKQLQALARAGILTSTSGPRGGFQLARTPAAISLLDIVAAIEGPEELFQCDQILRKGPGEHTGVDYRQSCAFAQAMRGADLAWRRELAGRTVADVRADVERGHPEAPADTRARIAELR